MSVVSDIILAGLDSGKPAASSRNDGYLYLSTDIAGGTLYRSNGSSWVAVAAGVSGSFTNPMDTQDDIIVGGAAGALGKLAKGTDGQVLTVNASTHHLDWETPGSGGHTIQDEGTPLTARANLNFVGAGVVATDDAGNDATVVTIAGGGGGGDFLVMQVFS